MFSVTTSYIDKHKEIALTNSRTGECVKIIPSLGGMLNGISLLGGEELIEIIDSCATAQDLTTRGFDYYMGIKLFPFPNRINKGSFSFQGQRYQLPTNETSRGHAHHGLVWKERFSIIDFRIELEQLTITLSYSYKGDLQYFPFPYNLTIIYCLHASQGFSCKTIIENTGIADLPFGDGWHPYFKLLSSINGLDLKMPPHKKIELDEYMIPTGKLLPDEDFNILQQILHEAFDTAYQLDVPSGICTTILVDRKNLLELQVWQETGPNKYNFLQLYSPPDRQSIAIEPMTCAPDVLNNGMGLIVLKPHDKAELSFGIRLVKV